MMFRVFNRKKREKISVDFPDHAINNICEIQNEEFNWLPKCPDNKTARLMELIGAAIDNWAVEFHLENLPKRIIFEQAYDAMRAVELAIKGKER